MTKIRSLLLFVVSLCFVMATAFPANAIGTKHVVIKEDSWSSLRSWTAPNMTGVGTHIETVRVTANTDYLFWPDGDAVNKIMPISAQVCYDLQSPGVQFSGVAINPYYFDDNTVSNPPTVSKDDVGDHGCHTEFFDSTDQHWLRMDQSPAWTTTGWLKLHLAVDQHWDFKWGDSRIKYFHPGDDPNIGDWFYTDLKHPVLK